MLEARMASSSRAVQDRLQLEDGFEPHHAETRSLTIWEIFDLEREMAGWRKACPSIRMKGVR